MLKRKIRNSFEECSKREVLKGIFSCKEAALEGHSQVRSFVCLSAMLIFTFQKSTFYFLQTACQQILQFAHTLQTSLSIAFECLVNVQCLYMRNHAQIFVTYVQWWSRAGPIFMVNDQWRELLVLIFVASDLLGANFASHGILVLSLLIYYFCGFVVKFNVLSRCVETLDYMTHGHSLLKLRIICNSYSLDLQKYSICKSS